MRGDCGVSTVNLFCVGVTVVCCVGVLSNLAYVCFEVMVQLFMCKCRPVPVRCFVCAGDRESVWVCFYGCLLCL